MKWMPFVRNKNPCSSILDRTEFLAVDSKLFSVVFYNHPAMKGQRA